MFRWFGRLFWRKPETIIIELKISGRLDLEGRSLQGSLPPIVTSDAAIRTVEKFDEGRVEEVPITPSLGKFQKLGKPAVKFGTDI
jgi:hypothetical protein